MSVRELETVMASGTLWVSVRKLETGLGSGTLWVPVRELETGLGSRMVKGLATARETKSKKDSVKDLVIVRAMVVELERGKGQLMGLKSAQVLAFLMVGTKDGQLDYCLVGWMVEKWVSSTVD